MSIIFLLLLGAITGIVILTFQGILPEESPDRLLCISQSELMEIAYQLIAFIGGIVGIALLFLYLNSRAFLRRIKASIREALEERHLEEELDHFYKVHRTRDLVKSIDQLFHLYRTFDQMKTSRCFTEIQTAKILMNSLEEGIFIVDNSKTVISINHSAEQMLRLIPGEMEGVCLSRKISNTTLLESIDVVIQKAEKVISKRIAMPERRKFQVTILPISNKQHEVIRALIILTPAVAKK